jgi:hypothetical protein
MERTSIETLAARLAAVEARLATSEQARQGAERRQRWWKGTALLAILCGLLLGYPQLGQAQGTLDQRVAVLEGKLARVSVVNNGADIVISGANLNIVNGLNDTQSANGLGNLIIGYNEARQVGNQRGGSHNLVLGQESNYTSFGGIIGGFQNTISGPFAHVLTGYQNGALSFYSCVTTGQGNNAANNYASVAGGKLNTASGLFAAVAGGGTNTASGDRAVVSGGIFNTASGLVAAVSGGRVNTASGGASVVSGGDTNTAAASSSTVGGGTDETLAASGSDWDWQAAGQLFPDGP